MQKDLQFLNFSQLYNDPQVYCQNRTFVPSLEMDGFLIISGCLFEADDIINFPVIFFHFCRSFSKHRVKTKIRFA